MAVAFRSSSSVSNNLTCSKPAGVVDGDFLVAICWSYNATAQTGPAGWTSRDTQTVSTEARIWTKIASSEGASWTWGGTSSLDTMIMAFSGAHASTPYNANATSTYTSAAPTSPGVTSTVDNCLLLAICLYAHTVTVVTKPASMTSRATANSEFVGADETLGAAGSTGTRTWSFDVSDNGAMFSIAIAPAAAGGLSIPVAMAQYRQRRN